MNAKLHTSTRDQVTEGEQVLADAVQEGSERITPALVKAAEEAESLVRRSAEALREQTAHLRERAASATDSTAAYIRDEPLKSVLIAAAAGAALMAVASLIARSHESR